MKVFNIYKFTIYLLLLAVLCSCNTTKVEEVPLTKTDSLSTIKCENFFILEGFSTEADFQEGLNIYLNNSTDDNPFNFLLETMTKFRFLESKIYANNGTSLDLFEDCSRSEYKDLVLIGSIFKLGTEISKESRVLNSGQMNLVDLQWTLNNGPNSIETYPETVGKVVVTSYQIGCLYNESVKNSFLLGFSQRYCKALERMLDSGSNAAVGQCFLEKLKDPNYAVPPCT